MALHMNREPWGAPALWKEAAECLYFLCPSQGTWDEVRLILEPSTMGTRCPWQVWPRVESMMGCSLSNVYFVPLS